VTGGGNHFYIFGFDPASRIFIVQTLRKSILTHPIILYWMRGHTTDNSHLEGEVE
jgi:hypothetical protein